MKKPGLGLVLAIVVCGAVILGADKGFRRGGDPELAQSELRCSTRGDDAELSVSFVGTPFSERGGIGFHREPDVEAGTGVEWCEEAVASLSAVASRTVCRVAPVDVRTQDPPHFWVWMEAQMLCYGERRDVLRAAAFISEALLAY